MRQTDPWVIPADFLLMCCFQNLIQCIFILQSHAIDISINKDTKPSAMRDLSTWNIHHTSIFSSFTLYGQDFELTSLLQQVHLHQLTTKETIMEWIFERKEHLLTRLISHKELGEMSVLKLSKTIAIISCVSRGSIQGMDCGLICNALQSKRLEKLSLLHLESRVVWTPNATTIFYFDPVEQRIK